MEERTIEEKLIIAESLLKECLAYVTYHYERSAVGYGKQAKQLIDAINKFIGGT